ncbi:hypothetical protein H8356DRAFT_1407399 [Neocallimastix lanati (nom. inval.)]|uniref:Uncharacterized protein n=1 Tax=Neocallimastix californiae TaxID=1754190 RepID=A0A1Y2DF88_9FUNG|nr:hypothetical protein H8356DRAFT_1407399 [Neocallimastix sp. JGI-2020a]ORY57941.1 hypothetical protein LY90DRAFT_506341 [Neocallimastix californiae]|eukprot:ORY57941.1 hypothetical protein LY90DRAFT_506341 [Neocallimastix californiae]
MKEQSSASALNNNEILRVISTYNELVSNNKNFTNNNETIHTSHESHILMQTIANEIDDILARIENVIPKDVIVVPNNVNRRDSFNYSLYLNTITYPKTAVLFNITMNESGFIQNIQIKDKFKTIRIIFLIIFLENTR